MSASATFRDRLQECRDSGGWSLRKLATAAGISASGVKQLLAGQYVPGIDTVEALAKALKVNAGWLAYGPPAVRNEL